MIEPYVATRYKSTWRAVPLQNLNSFLRRILFSGSTAASGLGPPHYRDFTITLRHTTLRRTPLGE